MKATPAAVSATVAGVPPRCPASSRCCFFDFFATRHILPDRPRRQAAASVRNGVRRRRPRMLSPGAARDQQVAHGVSKVPWPETLIRPL